MTTVEKAINDCLFTVSLAQKGAAPEAIHKEIQLNLAALVAAAEYRGARKMVEKILKESHPLHNEDTWQFPTAYIVEAKSLFLEEEQSS